MGIVLGLLGFALVLVCLFLGLLVLVQLPKKEAGLGMAFGAGTVDTLLGAGAGNALTKITKWTAGIFLALCLVLAWLINRQHQTSGSARAIRDAALKTPAAAAPGAPASPAVGSPTPVLNLGNAISNAATTISNTAASAVTNPAAK
jgi:preprotein translocase subunit SecG